MVKLLNFALNRDYYYWISLTQLAQFSSAANSQLAGEQTRSFALQLVAVSPRWYVKEFVELLLVRQEKPDDSYSHYSALSALSMCVHGLLGCV